MSENQTNTPVSSQGMTMNEIRAHLLLNGVKSKDIAKELGINVNCIYPILARRGNSRRIREAIAQAIHKPFEEVWGEITPKRKAPSTRKTPITGPHMTAREIRAQLILNGVKNIDIAKQLGVHFSAVTNIIAGRESSRPIQEAIAEAINKPFEEVWGKKTA